MPKKFIRYCVMVLSTCMSLSALTMMSGHAFEGPSIQSSHSNVVQGTLERITSSQMTVKGNVYQVASNVLVVNEEGGAVQDGLKGLMPQTKVALSLDNRIIVKVMIFGLLRQ